MERIDSFTVTAHFKSNHLTEKGKMRSISIFCYCSASRISCCSHPKFHHYNNKIREVFSQKESWVICWSSSLQPDKINYLHLVWWIAAESGLKTYTEESKTSLVSLLFLFFILEIHMQAYPLSKKATTKWSVALFLHSLPSSGLSTVLHPSPRIFLGEQGSAASCCTAVAHLPQAQPQDPSHLALHQGHSFIALTAYSTSQSEFEWHKVQWTSSLFFS